MSLDAAPAGLTQGDVVTHMVDSERLQQLRAGITSLSVRHREVVVLCDLHDVSYLEAAAVLNVPVGTVRSRLHRARQQLLEWMQEGETHPILAPRLGRSVT